MATGKSKTSFCIDSLLAQDKLPGSESSSSGQPQLIVGSYADSIRFRTNLFAGLHHHYPSLETPAESGGGKVSSSGDTQVDGEKEADGRQSSSSHKDDGSTSANGDIGPQPTVSCWTQPHHAMARLVYSPPSSSGTPTVSASVLNSSPSSTTASSSGIANYPGPLFTSPAAALHAAAAAAAAAVAASSPTAHQFHSAHLEWLARAGVLYHRFGADLSGKVHIHLYK